jgi:hypothetical protein
MVTTISTNPDTGVRLGGDAGRVGAGRDRREGRRRKVGRHVQHRRHGVQAGDRVCQMAKMFTYHHLVHVEEPDYGPGFVEAASLVETACAGFVPPPG